jgi:hypothetical protein
MRKTVDTRVATDAFTAPIAFRATTRKVKVVALLTTAVLAVGGFASGAYAAEGNGGAGQTAPATGTPDVFGPWTWSHDVAGQTSAPVDPDGRVETDLGNVVDIRDLKEHWTPGSRQTETTDWLTRSPGEGWVQVDQRQVKLSDATADGWADQVWHTYTGNWKQEGAPSPDDPNWHATSGNPQSENHAFENHTPNVPYFVSHNDSGNGDWFLWRATFVPGRDAVYRTEYRFERTVETPGHTEYSWSVFTRVNTPGTPSTPPVEPVEKPESPGHPGTTDSGSPVVTHPEPAHTVAPILQATHVVQNPVRPTGMHRAVVPTSIDAGL